MKKTKLLVAAMALPMAMSAMTASAAPVEIDYWSVFTGGDGATMQSMVIPSMSLRMRCMSTTHR